MIPDGGTLAVFIWKWYCLFKRERGKFLATGANFTTHTMDIY